MTLRLRVDSLRWNAQVDDVAAAFVPLVPVVKGNGYGFGRGVLAERAVALADRCHRVGELAVLAVGTVHELTGIPPAWRPAVLTPVAPDGGSAGSFPLRERLDACRNSPVITVGAADHISALDGWRGAVLVKLRSSMQRFGAAPDELDGLEKAVAGAGLDRAGYSIHLPLAGTDAARLAELGRWLGRLESSGRRPRELWVSHLDAATHTALRERWPAWVFPMRTGTALWHGDKSAFHLGANVLDVRAVTGGTVAGYRHVTIEGDGTLVMVGAGTAHGVAPLADGRSPFHYFRERLQLLERPHMHTSIAFVPRDAPCPAVGDVVDAQCPLTTVAVDEVIWQ